MEKPHFTVRAGLVLACATALLTGCSLPQQLGKRVTENSLRMAYGPQDPVQGLRESLTFATTFDNGLDADFAKGDAKLYSAPDAGSRMAGTPGLPPGDAVKLDTEGGRFGGALDFSKATKQVVFYQGATNLAYQAKEWNGTASFWLRLDPDKDLAVGSSDPIQFVAQTLTDGTMSVEFTKGPAPRHFRYTIQADQKIAMPSGGHPVVQVGKEAFSSDRWTHVVFTFEHANSGMKDGIGKLYLNGELAGTLVGFNNTLHWNPEQSVLNLGLSYVGGLDEVAIFDRALSAEEIRMLHYLPNGLKDVLYRDSGCPCIGPRKWLAKTTTK